MIVKRSLSIRGHQTSISVEDEFWTVLKGEAERRAIPLAALVAQIDAARRPEQNLSSAIRVFTLNAALARNSTE